MSTRPSAKGSRCPKCLRLTLRQKVNVFVDAPAACRNLSKSGIRSATVAVEGVGWDRALWYCSSPRCGYSLRLDAR